MSVRRLATRLRNNPMDGSKVDRFGIRTAGDNLKFRSSCAGHQNKATIYSHNMVNE